MEKAREEGNDQHWVVVGQSVPELPTEPSKEEEDVEIVGLEGTDAAPLMSGNKSNNDTKTTSLKRLHSPPPPQATSLSSSNDEDGATKSPSRKRLRIDDPTLDLSASSSKSACTAPHPTASDLLRENDGEISTEGDIFLSEGWRERWCRCSDVREVYIIYSGALSY